MQVLRILAPDAIWLTFLTPGVPNTPQPRTVYSSDLGFCHSQHTSLVLQTSGSHCRVMREHDAQIIYFPNNHMPDLLSFIGPWIWNIKSLAKMFWFCSPVYNFALVCFKTNSFRLLPISTLCSIIHIFSIMNIGLNANKYIYAKHFNTINRQISHYGQITNFNVVKFYNYS